MWLPGIGTSSTELKIKTFTYNSQLKTSIRSSSLVLLKIQTTAMLSAINGRRIISIGRGEGLRISQSRTDLLRLGLRFARLLSIFHRGRLTTLVATAHVIAPTQVRHQLQMWLHNDRVKELDASVILLK